MWAIALSAIAGGLDKIFGNRLGLGKRFDEGFNLIGPMISGMVGILCLTPILSGILKATLAPLFLKMGLDPSILAGILPIDMGGFQLAADMAEDPMVGLFSGVILTATFGCTLAFTIPVGFGMMKEENRKGFILGIMYGLIFIPIPLMLGGIISGLGIRRTAFQSLPILLLAFLLALGIWKAPEKITRGFMIFAILIRALSVIGILAGLTEYLTGFSLLPGILPLREALVSAALCSVLLIGCIPFTEILNRVFHRPLHAIGSGIGLQDKGITGLLLSLVSVTATLGAMYDMKPGDVTVNAAFLVSAAAVFGPHLSVCAINAPELVPSLITAKLIGGFCTAVFAVIMIRRKNHPSAA